MSFRDEEGEERRSDREWFVLANTKYNYIGRGKFFSKAGDMGQACGPIMMGDLWDNAYNIVVPPRTLFVSFLIHIWLCSGSGIYNLKHTCKFSD